MSCSIKPIEKFIKQIGKGSPEDSGNAYQSVLEQIPHWSNAKSIETLGCVEQLRQTCYNAWFHSSPSQKSTFHTQIVSANRHFYSSEELQNLTRDVATGLHILGSLYNLEAATAPGSVNDAIQHVQAAVTSKYGAQHIQVRAALPVVSIQSINHQEVLVIGGQ